MATEYDNFKWRETENGLWTRDVDEVEMAYTSLYTRWRGSGRNFFHMTGHLSLKVPVQSFQDQQEIERGLDAAARKAWMVLRYQHPTIASQVKLDSQTQKYVKAYPISTEGWLDETFDIIETGQTGIEWANNDPPAPPLPTLNLIKPPSIDKHSVLRDIVFRSPHDIIDGIGTLLLFGNYVQLVAEAFAQGDSYHIPSLHDPRVVQNLSPPFRVAAAIPPQPSHKILRRLADLDKAAQAFASSNAEIVALPYQNGAMVPGVHKRVEVVLSPSESSKLTAACKGIGVTVTHVFHAAIALTLRDLQPQSAAPRPVTYVGYLLRNERTSCIPPYNDHRHAAAVYHSVSSDKLVVDMTVPSKADGKTKPADERVEFLRIVRQLKDFYLKVRDDPDQYCLAPLLAARGTSPLPTDPAEALTVPAVPPPAEVASATISSMGRIDNLISQQYGAVEVYHPWVTGEELRNSLGLFLGTFRGELSLSAAYNDVWHNKTEVMGFVRRCVEVVTVGFGL